MRFRPGVKLTAAALPAFAALVGLGTWQVERLEWKEGVIAERAARLAAPPLRLAAGPAPGPEAAFRRAVAEGTFLHDGEMLVLHRTRRGRPGFEVVTPLRLDGGGHVLVNRGWVPVPRADPATRGAGQVAGRVRVSGVLRPPGKTSRWVPDNEPARGLWYYPEIDAMAAAAGLSRIAQLVLAADDRPNPGGLPEGAPAAVAIPNRHLEYAVTWYGLAAALAAVYVVLAARRGGGRRDGPR